MTIKCTDGGVYADRNVIFALINDNMLKICNLSFPPSSGTAVDM